MPDSAMKLWIPGLFLFLWGCGHNKPVISGDFGEVVSPNQNQVAIIWSKAGDSTIARQIQEEDDTLFIQTLEFSIMPIPLDSVSKIEIRAINHFEMTGQENKAGEELVKDAAKEAGIHGAIWLVIVLPVLVLGWLVGGYLDSLSG